VHVFTPAASMRLLPSSFTVVPTGGLQLGFEARDALGNILFNRSATWTTSNAVASVSATGYVRGSSADGTALLTATVGHVSDTATLRVERLAPTVIDVGDFGTCAVNTGGHVFCWGSNRSGNLGVPPDTGYQYVPGAVLGGTFSTVSVGESHVCALDSAGAAWCWGQVPTPFGIPPLPHSSRPAAVAGGQTFTRLSAGWIATCAIATGGGAWCWGQNTSGVLGTGDFTQRAAPTAVAGGGAFTAVTVGSEFACALDGAGAAWCWGDNDSGQLGTGGTGGAQPLPQAVTGGLTFTDVTAGATHVCGLTASGEAWCWGSNVYGELGTGDTVGASAPRQVTGGHTFTQISAGDEFTCGVDPAGRIWCWGWNLYGNLGNGEADLDATVNTYPFYPTHPVPTPVSDGAGPYARVTSGTLVACGIATSGVAYCWGLMFTGMVGAGDGDFTPIPVRVTGQ